MSISYFKYFLAIAVLFFGLSAASAFGRSVEFVFYVFCLTVIVISGVSLPRKLIILTLVCGLVASVVVSFHHGLSVYPFVKFTRPFVEGYLIALALYTICNIRDLKILLLSLAGYVLLEFASAIIMIVSPELRFSLLDQWYGGGAYDSTSFQRALIYRGYGVTRNHLYAFPLALGIISVLLLYGSEIMRNKLHKVLLISAAGTAVMLILINARIGIVPVFLLYALGITIYFRWRYAIQIIVISISGMFVFLLVIPVYMPDVSETIIFWLMEGVKQFFGTQSGDSTTFSILRDMIYLPKDLSEWLFGIGGVCERAECYSDIGWIRLLQEGGLVLAFFVLLLWYLIIYQIYSATTALVARELPIRSVYNQNRLLFLVLLITFIAAMTKWSAYDPSDFSRLMMMLAILMSKIKNNYRSLPAQVKHQLAAE